MAINKNHEFEELDGVKCAVVEKNASRERVEFLKTLLEGNGYGVVVVPSATKPAPVAERAEAPMPPTTFTIGVTDVTFNPINAVFGRLLKTKAGRTVTLAYWQQTEAVAHDEVPYFKRRPRRD